MLNVEENGSHRCHEIKNESLTDQKIGSSEEKASRDHKDGE